MPVINVQLFEGRTVEQKRAYAKALTDASVQVLGIEPGAVDVVFCDVKKSDWASGGRAVQRQEVAVAGSALSYTTKLLFVV